MAPLTWHLASCLVSPYWSKEVGAWNTTQARNETEDARARNTIHGKDTRSTKVVVIDVPDETALWKALPESKSTKRNSVQASLEKFTSLRAGRELLVSSFTISKRSAFRLEV